MIINYTVIGYSNSAAFLTSVLKCKKSVVSSVGRINCAVAEYSEYAALLVQSLFCKIIERKIQGSTIRFIEIAVNFN